MKMEKLELRKKQILDYMDFSDAHFSVYWQDKLSEINNKIEAIKELDEFIDKLGKKNGYTQY